MRSIIYNIYNIYIIYIIYIMRRIINEKEGNRNIEYWNIAIRKYRD